MIEYLEKLILDNWENWIEGVKPAQLDFLKTHAGQATRNKKVGFFVFNKTKPVIFVKTVREAGHNQIIKDSFEKLTDIYNHFNDDSVPKPFYLGDYQGLFFSLETAIVGKQFHSCEKQGDLNKFLEWFFRFQKAMVEKDKIQLMDFVDNLVSKFLELYKIEKNLEEMIKDMARDLKSDSEKLEVPSIVQHGDLTPDNVLKDEGKIKVIDWDNFGKIKLPLFDLLVFLQRWSGIRDVGFVNKYLDTIKRYLEEFRIDERALKPAVFCYYLLDFIRKKEILTDYDKEYLGERLKEIRDLRF